MLKSVFPGTDQSGAKDVGHDLQAEILKNAVDNLRRELIIAVPETRVQLELAVEQEFASCPMPTGRDLNAISRWEAELIHTVLGRVSQRLKSMTEGEDKDDRSTAVPAGESGGKKSTKSRTTKRKPSTSNPLSAEAMARDYLSATSPEALEKLIDRWRALSGHEVTRNLSIY